MVRAHIEDFTAVVLAEAASKFPYGILHESARAAAGEVGAFAADNLGPAIDAEAAAIFVGNVTMDMIPERCPGRDTLPSMCLFLWLPLTRRLRRWPLMLLLLLLLFLLLRRP